MKLVIIDGQGGGMGKALVERVRRDFPAQEIVAVGTNAMATSAMLRAGANAGATGENAVRICARDADVVMGPIGIVMPDAMLGEMTPAMAEAVGASRAIKILLPVGKCRVRVAGASAATASAAMDDAMRILASMMGESA